jgi:DNA-binding GntR family transcriptional regulator
MPRTAPSEVTIGGVDELSASSLREQAGHAIRAGIVTGELQAGEIYSAASIAERLGVSATPVREAMLDLAGAGLVQAVRNRGFRVVSPGEHDLDEIGELRLLVEVPAVRLVAERASDEGLAALEALLPPMAAAAGRGDMVAYLTGDRDFHLGLLELTGNRRLVRLVGQLRDQTRLIGKELADAGRLSVSDREHREILDALRARDADRAEALMRVHVQHTRGIWVGRAEAPGSG